MTPAEKEAFITLVYPHHIHHRHMIEGFSPEEIVEIEKAFDIRIQGDLWRFLHVMGRCAGHLFGDVTLIFYEGTHKMYLPSSVEDNYDSIREYREDYGFNYGEGIFVFAFYNEACNEAFLCTKSENWDEVYDLMQDGSYTPYNTGRTFLQYIQNFALITNTDLNPNGYLGYGDLLNTDLGATPKNTAKLRAPGETDGMKPGDWRYFPDRQ